MADVLSRAKPGCDTELMQLCGAIQEDEDLALPAAAWQKSDHS